MSELQFDGERAYQHLQYLCLDIGSRLGGSEGERKAAAYIADYFRSLGLATRLQEFSVRTYSVIENRLEVLDPPLGEIPCEIQCMNSDTPPEGITGEVVYVDSGAEEEVTPAVEGKIVLVLGGFRGDAILRAMRFHPLAVIAIEPTIATPPIRVKSLPEVRAKYGAVPTVRIAHEDGIRLVQAEVKKVRIIARTEEHDDISQNVIGELQGSAYPDEIVVIGGHYDTVLDIQGASDNTGGAVLVMELARIFSQAGSQRTMRFVAWGSEEMGLRGSICYVKTLKEKDKEARQAEGFVKDRDKTELDQHRLCINLDVHGAILGTNHVHVMGVADLSASARLLSKETGIAHDVDESVYSSDSAPFSDNGVPSISFVRSGGTTNYLHSFRDVIDYVHPEALERSGRFVELFMRRYIAGAAVLPFECKVPDDQRKKVRQYFEGRHYNYMEEK